MRKCTLTLSLFILVVGCRTFTVDDDYLKYLVYHGNEVLYFKSSKGDSDSIILQSPEKYVDTYDEFLDFDKFEQIDIGEEHSKPNALDSTNSNVYMSTGFAGLFANEDGKTYFYINMKAKDAVFEPFWGIPMNDFLAYKTSELSISCGKFSDVVIFQPEKVAIDYESNSNYITKVYWSKSYGLLRYDKKDSYWELDSTSVRKKRF